MNRSQINNDGVLRSTTIICPSCRSNEFYRDAQSGIVCIYCGLEMPNFLLESQEEAGRGDEEGEVVFGSRRLLRTAQKAKVQRSTFRVSVAELLSIYQYCLILMTKELARLLSVNDAQAASLEADFLHTAKSLWVEYLGRWKNCPTPCKIEGIFYKHFFTSSNNRFCRCGSPFDVSNHPCFPTKPLLLGFLGLILRLHRSSCIPADLVRFCDRGLLPYHNLWESLPEHVRQPIEHSHYTRFFTLKHPGRLTPMNVWYHVTSLADALRIALPPLNTPAVALSLIATELITNAFKYAFAEAGGRVAVRVAGEAEGRVRLSVCDDGKGLPTDWPDAPARGTGLGMKLIRAMLDQINARLEVENGPGACFTVTA